MKILFTKTSDYYGDGDIREFKNLDEAIICLMTECSNDGKYGRSPVELIVFKDANTIECKCDYTIEYYDDWRE